LNSSMDKGISEIVGVFSDPILVFPGGWGDTLPEWQSSRHYLSSRITR